MFRCAPMIPNQKEKTKNAIGFFALLHKKKTGKDLPQTFLYKYLAFLDFDSVQENGEPVLGLEYYARKLGPVPDKIYDYFKSKKEITTDLFVVKNIHKKVYMIIPTGKEPDLDFFTNWELNKMESLVNVYGNRYNNTKDVIEKSHELITAWKNTKLNRKINYKDFKSMFGEDIPSEEERELSAAENHYLTWLELNGCI